MSWAMLIHKLRSQRRFGRDVRPSLVCRPRLEGLEDRLVPSTVTNLNDAGSGSLRDAINITGRGGTINFASGLSGTVTLTTGNLPIGKDLTINGPGANSITISGNSNFQVFNIAPGTTVNINGLKIVNGISGFINGTPNAFGGGIFNGGALTLTNDVIQNNMAQNTLFSGGQGGGIYNAGGLTIINCLIASNLAQSNGAVLIGSGGGVYNVNQMTLTNVTITANSAAQGGGIGNANSPPGTAIANLNNVTFASNSGTTSGQGGGLFIGAGSVVNMLNTLVANNTAGTGPDISGSLTGATTLNNNLVRDGSDSIGINNGTNGNQVGSAGAPINPVLGNLRDNGGPTFTLALLAGSPAIDAGSNTNAPTTDQRGFNRPVNGTTDIGAYEYQQPATNLALTLSASSAFAGQQITFSVTVTAVASNSNPIPGGTITFTVDGTSVGTAPLSNGMASFTGGPFTVGSHTIMASYGGFALGDFTFSQSSNSAMVMVQPLNFFAVGGAPGRVVLASVSNGAQALSFAPFVGYTGRINVALGDLNHDGIKDLIVAASDGNPAVKVYNGAAIRNGSFSATNPDASLLLSFFAYGLQFNIGANVAVGDVNGDGFPDLITGATAGNPQVNVYDGRTIANGTFNATTSLLASFFAYGLQFNIGANVAAGDVNGDGFADIVTGATAGNPQVKVYSGAAIAHHTFSNGNPDASLLASFFAYGLNFNVGAFVAVGTVTGTSFGSIITGASVGNPQVKVYSGQAIANGTFNNNNPDASLQTSFFAYNIGFNIGVTVAASDFDASGRAEILTGASQGSPQYRVVSGLATGTLPPAINGIDAFALGITGGISVGA